MADMRMLFFTKAFFMLRNYRFGVAVAKSAAKLL
jgi:hypothetical protein